MAHEDRASRRAILQAGVGVLVAGTVQSVSAQPPPKLNKQAVMYQDQPKGDQQCDKCVRFQPPNACQVVEGVISPKGWCGVFAPKPA